MVGHRPSKLHYIPRSFRLWAKRKPIRAQHSLYISLRFKFSNHGGSTQSSLSTLSHKEADSLFWSPRGKLIVVAGLKKCFGGKLQFFNVDQRKQISKVIKPSKANHVAWDPSGRYVATAFTIPQHKFDPNYGCVRNDPLERFHMLSSNGYFLYCHQFDYPLIQLDYGGGIIDDELLKMQKNPFED